jgi:hypothetical protein
VTVSGSGSGEVEVIFPFSSDFTVKASEASVPGPKMKRAVFSSDGSKIVLEFDIETNGLSSKSFSNCSKLFHFITSSPSPIAPSLPSRCLWVNEKSLEMYSVSALNVGDVIELKKNVLKARCTSRVDPLCASWPFSLHHNITISVDPNLLSPVVVTLNLPKELGACDDLSLDLSSSVGSGGRDWKSISFTISNYSSSQISSPLQQYLANLTSSKSFSLSLSLPLLVPNNLLT